MAAHPFIKKDIKPEVRAGIVTSAGFCLLLPALMQSMVADDGAYQQLSSEVFGFLSIVSILLGVGCALCCAILAMDRPAWGVAQQGCRQAAAAPPKPRQQAPDSIVPMGSRA